MALPLPIHRTFTYRINTESQPPLGTRVLVPFRQQEHIGWVVGPGSAPEIKQIRPVLSILDDSPQLPVELLDLCRWMAEYYVAPLGMALRTALPAVLSDVSRNYVRLLEDPPLNKRRSREERVVTALEHHGK
ncbi:MAG: primosomal protein N', partial [Gemmatimonadota bacterium]|nr:primosomal protein N' [Gemmatimonadota bacterium]